MKYFQTIVLIVFGALGLVGVLVFALQQTTTDPSENIPELTMWGTLPEEYFDFLSTIAVDDRPYLKNISYREIREENFDQELVESLADGRSATGPDLILLSNANLYEHLSKVQLLPYEQYSRSEYSETFLPISEIFLFDDGIAALPAVVDPLVMYWNEPLLTTHGYSSPPEVWSEMRGFSENLTQTTEEFLDISQSGVSLGTYDNIDHAKEIISLLLMQSGSRIVTKQNGSIRSDFSQTISELSLPPSEALNFYTEFADPDREVYSWNTSLRSSRDVFLAGDLALYFGFASERDELIEDNPNLAFRASQVPQVTDSPITMTIGEVYGFAALKGSDTPEYARQALYALSSPDTLERIENRSELPSVYRARANEDPTDSFSRTLVRSALTAQTWLDPDDQATDNAFREVITSVRSNELDPNDALSRLRSRIDMLLNN